MGNLKHHSTGHPGYCWARANIAPFVRSSAVACATWPAACCEKRNAVAGAKHGPSRQRTDVVFGRSTMVGYIGDILWYIGDIYWGYILGIYIGDMGIFIEDMLFDGDAKLLMLFWLIVINTGVLLLFMGLLWYHTLSPGLVLSMGSKNSMTSYA